MIEERVGKSGEKGEEGRGGGERDGHFDISQRELGGRRGGGRRRWESSSQCCGKTSSCLSDFIGRSPDANVSGRFPTKTSKSQRECLPRVVCDEF